MPQHAGARQHHELQAFARYCILRVERELGKRESWVVNIAPAPSGFSSHIAVDDRGVVLEDRGSGQDGTLATWDAMCRLEQRLREHHRRSHDASGFDTRACLPRT